MTNTWNDVHALLTIALRPLGYDPSSMKVGEWNDGRTTVILHEDGLVDVRGGDFDLFKLVRPAEAVELIRAAREMFAAK